MQQSPKPPRAPVTKKPTVFRVLALLGILSLPVKASVGDQRVTVAVLPLTNGSGNTNYNHWLPTMRRLVEGQMGKAHRVHVVPVNSVEFAFRDVGIIPGQVHEISQVRQLGEVMGAHWVVWGAYSETEENAHISLQVLDMTADKPMTTLTRSSMDRCHIASELAMDILQVIKVDVDGRDKEAIERPPTTSLKALTLLSLAIQDLEKYRSVSNALVRLKEAVEVDPNFATAQRTLAECYVITGDLTHGETAAIRAIHSRPDYADPHCTLGVIYNSRGSNLLAEAEFLKAIKLDPDQPDSYWRLGECYTGAGKWADAISILRKAVEIGPYESLIHAQLADVYAHLGKRALALQELRAAERFDNGMEPGIQQSLATVYDLLHENSRALECYENFMAEATKIGLSGPLLGNAEARLRTLKRTLTTEFVEASIPKDYSAEEVSTIAKSRLAPSERRLVTDPLTPSSKMKNWAMELTANDYSEQAKAAKLYDGLTRRLDLADPEGRRTAVQVFQDWADPSVSFTCQEYSLLYVALARSIGLKAYYVVVDRDYQGKTVGHACAGIFLNAKALLVDPAYHWFGCPHQAFRFQNDLQVTALYLCQLHDLEKMRVAARLCPDCALAQFNLALKLAQTGDKAGAKEHLQTGKLLEPDSWFGLYAEGAVDYLSNCDDTAVPLLRKSIDLNADFALSHYFLGAGLNRQGKLIEARNEYRSFLSRQKHSELTSEVRRELLQINEKLGGISE